MSPDDTTIDTTNTDGAASAAATSSTDGATAGIAVSEINPSNALAGTSGKLAGTNNTGMAAGSGIEKVASVDATTEGDNAGIDAAPGVNVKAPANAPHPIEALTLGKTGDLRQWIDTLEQSVVVIRMKQDLENLEGWIKQHFAELKRKV